MAKFSYPEKVNKFTCPKCGHIGYRYIKLCSKCRKRTAKQRPPQKQCKICGNIGKRESDICRQCAGKNLPSYRGFVCKCGNKKDWNSKHCKWCSETHNGRVIWSEKDIEFLIKNYPSKGAKWCAEKLNKPYIKVRNKANKLKIKLNKDATHRIVHNKASVYMKNNNPSRMPGASERLSEQAKNNPDVLQKLFEGHAKLQRRKPSKLEKNLWEILESLNVKFEKNPIIKPKFVVDVKIGNLIIESDGDWWHGHKRFEPLNERQIKQQKRDASRNKYLTTCGYNVERIWESDMSHNIVVNILQKYNII